jgi:hypothetical protein
MRLKLLQKDRSLLSARPNESVSGPLTFRRYKERKQRQKLPWIER